MANEVTIDVKARDKGATSGLNNIKNNFSRMLSGLKGLAVAAGADLATSLAAPATVAVAGLSVELAGAGAALGAFGLAVKPQVSAITDLTAAHDAYDKAVLKSGASSTTAQGALKFYNAQLKQLPPATQDAAKGFFNLRDTFKSWSNSLAGTTMPIFTRGMKVLQGIIPKLTPLVRVAAASLDDFMASIESGVKGGGLDRFLSSITRVAADSLPRLLGAAKNVAVGIGNLFMAFAPLTSGSLSGGLEKLTAKFANWTRSLRGNPEFERFVRQMQANLPGIFGLLGNLLLIVGKISGALLPFSGLTLKVAEAFASLIAAIPQDVMNWLAPTIAGIALAVKAWSIAQGLLNIAMAASPIGLIVLAIAGIGVALYLAYTRSATFRKVVKAAFDAVRDAATSLKDKAGPVVESIAQFFTDTLPAAFDEGVGALLNIVGQVDVAVKQVQDKINGLASGKGISGGGGKGKKKGLSPLAALGVEFALGINEITGKVKKFTGWLSEHFSKRWVGHLAMEGLGAVKSVAGRAKDAALGYARRAYHAFLHAHFPGSSVVTHAVKMAVGFARGKYQATLRAVERVRGVIDRVLGWLRGLAAGVTIPIHIPMPNFPHIPGFNRLGGVKRMQGGGNTTLVGEEGPELVDMPPGAYVRPEATTRGRMMAGRQGGGGHVVLEFAGNPSGALDRLMWEWIKTNVRVKGGKGPASAQKALGFGG